MVDIPILNGAYKPTNITGGAPAMQMLRRAFLIGAATFGRVGWGRVKQTNAGFDIHKAHQNTSIWQRLRCDMQTVSKCDM